MVYCVGHQPIHNQKKGGGGGSDILLRSTCLRFMHKKFSLQHNFPVIADDMKTLQ